MKIELKSFHIINSLNTQIKTTILDTIILSTLFPNRSTPHRFSRGPRSRSHAMVPEWSRQLDGVSVRHWMLESRYRYSGEIGLIQARRSNSELRFIELGARRWFDRSTLKTFNRPDRCSILLVNPGTNRHLVASRFLPRDRDRTRSFLIYSFYIPLIGD